MQEGNLYGTTTWGGPNNCSPPYECGTVFKLTHRNSAWVLQTLYTFDPTTGSDGYAPIGQLARNPSGVLYGTTQSGGPKGDGTVLELRPSPTRPVSVVAPWMETRIHDFGFNDGEQPIGDLLLDSAGNLYGTTCFGGANALGTVYKLTPSDGGWTYAVLYSFTGGYDGGCPHAGVVLDAAGNRLRHGLRWWHPRRGRCVPGDPVWLRDGPVQLHRWQRRITPICRRDLRPDQAISMALLLSAGRAVPVLCSNCRRATAVGPIPRFIPCRAPDGGLTKDLLWTGAAISMARCTRAAIPDTARCSN